MLGCTLPSPMSGARVPGLAPIVGDRHEREIEAVGIERHDEPRAIDEGMRARHPAEAGLQFVLRGRERVVEVGFDLRLVGASFEAGDGLLDGGGKFRAGLHVDHIKRLPLWCAVAGKVGGAFYLEQRGFPLVVEDGGPDQPEHAARIDDHAAVGVGQIRRIGHDEGLTPGRRAAFQPRAHDLHIVLLALAGAVEPADEEIAVAGLDEA